MIKAMAAAGLIQNQLYLYNRNSQHRPAAFAKSATSWSATLLPGSLFGAANSFGNSIRSNNFVILVPEPSRRPRPRPRNGDTSSVATVPTSGAPLLVRRRGSFTKMEGVGWVHGEVDSSRRVMAVKASGKQVVIMVDPVEAKRLAAAEMKAIQARAKLKRQTEIEAINGGWAMIGLTAGIVIDGYTGKSILLQIAGYLDGIVDILTPLTSSS
ncbi:unnamed protein product [Calypogeia fissa]